MPIGKPYQLASFPYFFHTRQQKSHPEVAKLLIYMVGDASFELATPAV
jgi:hypothetical protein